MSEWIFFCSHKPSAKWHQFSQWFDAKFVVKDEVPYPLQDKIPIPAGTVFKNCEAWMMYGKAILFGDRATAAKILAADDPREVKKLGREVMGFDRETWESVAYEHVVNGNYLKFTQNPELADVLRSTGERPIAEAADYDTIWGIGYSEADAMQHQAQWGQNLLGKALQRVRTALI